MIMNRFIRLRDTLDIQLLNTISDDYGDDVIEMNCTSLFYFDNTPLWYLVLGGYSPIQEVHIV